MSNQFGYDDYNSTDYDARSYSLPSNDRANSGGYLSVGDFGQSSLSPYEESPVMRYVNRINPNLCIIGILVVAGMTTMSMLLSTMGTANPNNVMMQTQKAQAEAAKEQAKADAEAFKAAAKPSCGITLICRIEQPAPVMAATPAPAQSPEPYYQQQPYQEQPYYPPSDPNFSNSPVITQPVQPSPSVPPTDATTVEFWLYYRNDTAYIDQWYNHCSTYGWNVQPECSALYKSLS